LTPSPILKALSTIRTSGTRALLMGGQACVLYGAAEFSRDTDLVVFADEDNLRKLSAATAALDAEVIAVPPFERRYLEAGHAVHFRCRAAGVAGLRVDVMARLRGLPDFETLWARRTTLETEDGSIEVLSLPDLVMAKKTQRDKDWPMITRLVESHYAASQNSGDLRTTEFWLRELRTPAILVDVARGAPEACLALAGERPLLVHALDGAEERLRLALRDEEDRERAADRKYWEPLRRELEQLRHARRG
jgi:hypothetical protein